MIFSKLSIRNVNTNRSRPNAANFGRKGNDRSESGFTLIELLIVIVVIAILAAISVVAYSGIQKRAVAASYATAANQAHKAIKLAEATGSYNSASLPFDDGYLTACIGLESDFPADDNFASGECAVSSDGSFRAQVNSQVTEYLLEANPGFKLPALQTTELNVGGELIRFRGIVLSASGGIEGDHLQWPSPDNASCGPGEYEDDFGFGLCSLILRESEPQWN